MRVAFTGKMCTGKTHAADALSSEYKLEKRSFAAKIKELARDLFGMTEKDRGLLQSLGEKMKEIDNDVWVNFIERDILRMKKSDGIVIDDLRFQHELDMLKRHGFLIVRLSVPDDVQLDRLKKKYPKTWQEHVKGMGHVSETRRLNGVDLDVRGTDPMGAIIAHIKKTT